MASRASEEGRARNERSDNSKCDLSDPVGDGEDVRTRRAFKPPTKAGWVGCARETKGARAEPKTERARTKRTEGRGVPTKRSGEGSPRAEDGEDEQGEGTARARLRARPFWAGRREPRRGRRGTGERKCCTVLRTPHRGHRASPAYPFGLYRGNLAM